MKEKQLSNLKKGNEVPFGSNDHNGKTEEPTTTRKELSKIAGTSESSIKRTKYILDNGTDEQIERARKGGSGNSIGTIEREIKESVSGERKCNRCGKMLPISSFYDNRSVCKKCHCKSDCKNTDLKGRKMYIPQFWCGVGATILVEILWLIGIITYSTLKANKKNLQKDTEKNWKNAGKSAFGN